MGQLRNSSSIHEGDNKCSEYVYLRKNSDGFLGDVAYTFSPDVAGFEFCNTPLMKLDIYLFIGQ